MENVINRPQHLLFYSNALGDPVVPASTSPGTLIFNNRPDKLAETTVKVIKTVGKVSTSAVITVSVALNAGVPPTYGVDNKVTLTVGTRFPFGPVAADQDATYSIEGGFLIDANTGVITWDAHADKVGQTLDFKVTKKKTGFLDAPVTIKVTVQAGTQALPLTYGTNNQVNFIVNAASTSSPANDAGATYALSGSLPGSLEFNTSTGAITGTPTVEGVVSNLRVTRTKQGYNPTEAVISVTVDPTEAEKAIRVEAVALFGGCTLPPTDSAANPGLTCAQQVEDYELILLMQILSYQWNRNWKGVSYENV